MSAGALPLRDELRAFVRPSTARGVVAVAGDLALFLIALYFAVTLESTWLRALVAVGAGVVIAGLFVLAHDAAHNSITASPGLNRALAYVCLLPALHNPTLWRIAHNREHHQAPNVARLNSWSPLSLAEYRALPAWRRLLERYYRSGLGFWLYYLIHRWLGAKLLPRADTPADVRNAAWRDVVFLAAGLTLWCAAVIALARQGADASPWRALLFGVVVPFGVWNFMMGCTVYYQHTHPAIPWFRSRAEMEAHGGQERIAVSIDYARWYGFLSHDIMQHHAHHVHPLVPHYRLHAAEGRLRELCPDIVVLPFTLRAILDVHRRCKLYDYDRGCWLDFAGEVTAVPPSRASEREPA